MGPVCLICLIAVVPGLLILRSPGPDLAGLTPKNPLVDGALLIAWSDLERGHIALRVGGPSAGISARVLGYMMEGDHPVSDGQMVARFVLLPDAGNAVHPAHRFGDQMIDVCLKPGDTRRFAAGSLVWAWGKWKPLAGNPHRDKPLYQLEYAHVESADKADIARYFR